MPHNHGAHNLTKVVYPVNDRQTLIARHPPFSNASRLAFAMPMGGLHQTGPVFKAMDHMPLRDACHERHRRGVSLLRRQPEPATGLLGVVLDTVSAQIQQGQLILRAGLTMCCRGPHAGQPLGIWTRSAHVGGADVVGMIKQWIQTPFGGCIFFARPVPRLSGARSRSMWVRAPIWRDCVHPACAHARAGDRVMHQIKGIEGPMLAIHCLLGQCHTQAGFHFDEVRPFGLQGLSQSGLDLILALDHIDGHAKAARDGDKVWVVKVGSGMA